MFLNSSLAERTNSLLGQQSPDGTGTILDRLKSETASHHDRLEKSLDLLRPSFTKQDYSLLLSSFYGFYKPWEEQSWPVLGRCMPGFCEGRQKLPFLREDLRFLGKMPETLPVAKNLPSLTTVSEVLGSCYVLEGATLGGQVLSRHFARTLCLDAQGLAYFRCYGEKTGAMWKSFQQALLCYVAPAEENVVVRSAVETFTSLEVWLAEVK